MSQTISFSPTVGRHARPFDLTPSGIGICKKCHNPILTIDEFVAYYKPFVIEINGDGKSTSRHMTVEEKKKELDKFPGLYCHACGTPYPPGGGGGG